MKYKSEKLPTAKTSANPKVSSNARILKLTSEFSAMREKEWNDYHETLFQQINKECYIGNKYDQSKLAKLIEDVYDNLSENAQEKMFKLLEKRQKLDDLSFVTEVRNIIAGDKFRFSSLASTLPDFLKIIDTDEKLESFLKNPQKYINDNNGKLSIFELQVLEVTINNPAFNQLASINRVHDPKSFVYTPLTAQLYQLNLSQYGSMDAGAFEDLIPPSARESVLAKAKQPPKKLIMGLGGAQATYKRSAIAETAEKVRESGLGACHSFALLAADHLLKKMDTGELPQMDIKMVSHKRGRYSHTYLLLNHNSQDLTNLSQSIIVDPWAVVMGHTKEGYGAFLTSNYPFPQMTSQLVTCYDSQEPEVEELQSEETAISSQSFREHLAKVSVVSGGSFFSQKLDFKQQIAVNFLEDLKNYINTSSKHGLKLELLNVLKREVIAGDTDPGVALKVAAQAVLARSIEKTGNNNFRWNIASSNISDETLSTLLPAFEKSKPFWNKYLSKHEAISTNEKISKMDVSHLRKVVDLLPQKEEHTFSADSENNKQVTP
ncbi:hypothetical protein [Legionella cherrii]|uniref:Dot/Icm T4SS effector n=1 Tax=Legionella cherrii TaxID=28084 RepID=A0ABY6T6P3_9GAMM|nr:hypothetical protein [Legionella cherrii]VEB37137.1 Uncharacterised protein [Legionella cherrii]